MSIIQEYDKIKKNIGEEKWNSIDIYIKSHYPELRLDQIIYNTENWIDFEKWFYKQKEIYSVNVVSDVWKTVYDDYRASVEIANGEIKKGNVIVRYDEDAIRNLTGNLNKSLNEDELKNAIGVLVSTDFKKYISLPKISEVSPLLKEVYYSVRESDTTICHITSEEWKDYYSEHYSEKDLDELESKIKKYGLEEVLEVFGREYLTSDNKIIESDYRIIGYGDLETCFIDDSKLNLVNKEQLSNESYLKDDKASEMALIEQNEIKPSNDFIIEDTGGHTLVIFGKLTSDNYYTLSEDTLVIYDDDYYTKAYMDENVDDYDFYCKHFLNEYNYKTKEYTRLLEMIYEKCNEASKKVYLFDELNHKNEEKEI